MNNEIEKNVDIGGASYKVTATLEENNNQKNYNYQYNMGRDNYTFANRPSRPKVRTLRRDMNVVGRKDAGFSQVAILSVVVCIAILVIAYFAFRF